MLGRVVQAIRRFFARPSPSEEGAVEKLPARDRLGAALAFLEGRLPGVHLPHANTPQQDVAIAAIILLRAATVQGWAIHALAGTRHREAAVANLRQMFEAWVDLRYLLLHGDPIENAHRSFVFAHMDLLAFLQEYGAGDKELKAEAEKVTEALQGLSRNTPDVYRKVEGERKAGSQYWSGKGRRKLIGEVGEKTGHGAKTLQGAYKLYSWEAHHVVNFLRDFRAATTEKGVEIGFGFGADAVERGEDCCERAQEMVRDGWAVFCQVFPQPRM